ncbi:MAG: hypothetical protein K6A23_06665 [Butyrivibrio sp.]|nr:hypothetical protein [Butyrivibrio sp.]
MKLKYYLRGVGIGVIIASIVMGIALGGRKEELSETEIRQKAMELGMVDGAGSGTLAQYNSSSTDESAENSIVIEDISNEQISENVVSSSEGESDKDSAALTTIETENQESSSTVSADASGSDNSVEEITVTESSAESTQINENINEDTALAATTSEPVSQSPAEGASTLTAEDGSKLEVTENTNTGTLYVTVVIPKGIGSDTVSSILKNAGLVADGTDFNRFLVNKGLDRYIRSGTKMIPEGATYDEIAEIICRK